MVPVDDVISITLPISDSLQHSNGSISQQVFPALDAPSPSINSSRIPSNCGPRFEDFNYKCFTIHYAKRLVDPNAKQGNGHNENINKWRIDKITLHNSDNHILYKWYETLSKVLKGKTRAFDLCKRQLKNISLILALNRPRKLLLFVNPYGGKKNALNIYEKYAKPIFRLANVDVSVIISQRPNQIFDLVLQQHLDQFDAIACCGGDGTFSELFNGIIYRKMMTENSNSEPSKIDIDRIPKPEKPLGVIPAGSTDTICYCLHGTTDIKTSIIHIVLGQTSGLDISSVSSNDKGVMKFYASVMSYGYLGDLMAESERFRWMGPRRYEWAGFKKILGNKGYDVEVTIQQETEIAHGDSVINNCDVNNMRCFQKCSICLDTSKFDKVSDEKEETYKKITGKFFMVNAANISCACRRSPLGFTNTHIGDGRTDIILVRHGSILNNLKLLLALSSKKGSLSNLPFVEIYRTRKMYFKSLNSSSDGSLTDSTFPISLDTMKSTSIWNCDGELLQETDVFVR